LSKVAVCLIVKNEAKYLVEWLAHYLALGFDEILVYDNASTDATYRVVESIARRECSITLHPWPDVEGSVPQLTAYNDALGRVQCEWLAFFDADELLVLKQHSCIQEYLARFPDDAGAVAVNWALFGSSGHKDYVDELQSLRFRLRATDELPTKNTFVKSIARKSAVAEVGVHAVKLKAEFKYYFDDVRPGKLKNESKTHTVFNECAQLNHYVVRSLGEFQLKRARGRATRLKDAPDKFGRDEKFFRTHDTNHIEDSAIDDWIDRAGHIRSSLRAHLADDGVLYRD
jgi:glycosyltransferase involved in cell wall biosynthesis